MEVLTSDKTGKIIKGYICARCLGPLDIQFDERGIPMAKCFSCSRATYLKRQKHLWKPKDNRGQHKALH